MNYAKNGIQCELVGIENMNGADYYVMKTVDGKNESYDYFNKNTFMKEKTINIMTRDGETMESTVTYGDFKEVNGMKFAHTITQSVGPMVLSGTVTSMTVNGKIDLKIFE
jgi:predicted secreted protein